MKGTSPSRGCGEVAAFGIESAMMEFLDFINTSGTRKRSLRAVRLTDRLGIPSARKCNFPTLSHENCLGGICGVGVGVLRCNFDPGAEHVLSIAHALE